MVSLLSTPIAETWEWDGAGWAVRMPASSPPARSLHALAYDTARTRLVLFGGSDLDGLFGCAEPDCFGHCSPLCDPGMTSCDVHHARVLRTPLEVKNCLRYVLLNGRRHAVQQGRRIGPEWFDPCSSAAWFGGWAERPPWREPWMRELRGRAAPTAPARSWLLATGWKEKRGSISIADTPGPRHSTVKWSHGAVV